MKFKRLPNDQYIVAKRVSIELEKHKDILVPSVEGRSIEPIAIGQDIDKKQEHRLFLYHSNSALKFDTKGELTDVVLVNKRDIIMFIELQPGEIVVDRLSMLPIRDPEMDWIW